MVPVRSSPWLNVPEPHASLPEPSEPSPLVLSFFVNLTSILFDDLLITQTRVDFEKPNSTFISAAVSSNGAAERAVSSDEQAERTSTPVKTVTNGRALKEQIGIIPAVFQIKERSPRALLPPI